jgi:hypothetical protein
VNHEKSISKAAWREYVRQSVSTKAHLANQIDCALLEEYSTQRRHTEVLWALLSQPLKFPARRRRTDRTMPQKAA